MQRLEREGVVQRDALSFIETVDGSGELVAVQLQGRLFAPSGKSPYAWRNGWKCAGVRRTDTRFAR